jgi:hypothetical protein
LNPAGIGITGNATAQPFTIANVDESARLFVQCIYSMVKKAWHPGVPIPEKARSWMDGIWLAKVRHPLYPKGVEQVNDQHIIYYIDGDMKATWAADDAYMGHVQRFNALIPGVPDQSRITLPIDPQPEEPPVSTPVLTPSVKKPVIYDLATDYARFGLTQAEASRVIGYRFANRNGGSPQFIFLHIQDGSTAGSLDWWANGYTNGVKVTASATVMVQKDGSVLRIIPEQHGPWTNGDVNRPTAQASDVLALGGNPNNWSLTVEAEGGPWDQMPAAQRDAIIWVVQDWYIRYPAIRQRGAAAMKRHGWINSVSRPNCPGDYFPLVVNPVAAWLTAAPAPQPDPEPEPVPEPLYPKGMTEELARRLYGQVTVPWAANPLAFDPERSECQYWLARGKLRLKPGESYTATTWPPLEDVIRRGSTKNVHVYQWANGDVFEKVVRSPEAQPAAA